MCLLNDAGTSKNVDSLIEGAAGEVGVTSVESSKDMSWLLVVGRSVHETANLGHCIVTLDVSSAGRIALRR